MRGLECTIPATWKRKVGQKGGPEDRQSSHVAGHDKNYMSHRRATALSARRDTLAPSLRTLERSRILKYMSSLAVMNAESTATKISKTFPPGCKSANPGNARDSRLGTLRLVSARIIP